MSIADPLLPPSVAPTWRARTAEWERRGGSDRAGVPDRPLFMGGCPRSGTTLLQVMLDMRPELGMPRETNFIRELWWPPPPRGHAHPANRRRVAEWIFSDTSTCSAA